MKNILFKIYMIGAMLFCCLTKGMAQAPELTFDFDAAGNQVVRQFVCINCTPFSQAALFSSPVALTSTIPPADAKKNTGDSRNLIAFPNPLTEVLTLKWDNLKYYIKTVEVASMSGTIVYTQSYPYIEGNQQVTVPFNKQVAGMYMVIATYSDGKRELVKVIKNGF